MFAEPIWKDNEELVGFKSLYQTAESEDHAILCTRLRNLICKNISCGTQCQNFVLSNLKRFEEMVRAERNLCQGKRHLSLEDGLTVAALQMLHVLQCFFDLGKEDIIKTKLKFEPTELIEIFNFESSGNRGMTVKVPHILNNMMMHYLHLYKRHVTNGFKHDPKALQVYTLAHVAEDWFNCILYTIYEYYHKYYVFPESSSDLEFLIERFVVELAKVYSQECNEKQIFS